MQSSKNLTCLLVDDDPDDHELFSETLKDVYPFIKCTFANDAHDALHKIRSAHFLPDVIILDMNMPGMNGVQCLKELRKIKLLDEVPVYIYSTSSDECIREICKNMGAADYIVKPNNIPAIKKNIVKFFHSLLHKD
jgi:CheY-like chemotaxis protein